MYMAKLTVCSEIHTKHIKLNVITMHNFLTLNVVACKVTGRL